MPETLTILEKSVSYRWFDSFLLGLTWTVLAALGVRALWKRQRRILGGLLALVVLLFALTTVEMAGDLYRDTHPAGTAFTFADDQVTIQRSQDEKPITFRRGEVKQLSLAPLKAGETDQLLLFSNGSIYVMDVAADKSSTLAQTLARTLELTETTHTMDTWRSGSKAE